MAEIEKISLKCSFCGKEFQCNAPTSPGNYSVLCPYCKKMKVSFHFPINVEDHEEKAKVEIKFGLLDDGSYRFRCNKLTCQQSVLVRATQVNVGLNKIPCPKCGTIHEFEIQPTVEDLLKCPIKCRTAGCDGILNMPIPDKSDCGDQTYFTKCEKCERKYAVKVKDGKVMEVRLLTEIGLQPPQWPMKLVLGNFLGKKEYKLSKGIHYVGRLDDESNSDFAIKDKYASKRSVRIDVNEEGVGLVYKLTVERATNPVYHNSRELTVGDIVYLTYGDTLKLGKTLIKVQKIQK